ncbi:MAG: C39 family peptidase [Planctomycetota bacterium]|nr:C39 family peptidase [Planctomycetota bacterium]
MRISSSFSPIFILAALAAWLGGCGSSFPHDSARIVWSADSAGPAPGMLAAYTLGPGSIEVPAVYESPIIASTLGVEQLAVSWNADVPPRTGMWVEVRVRADPDAMWSDWLLLGGAGSIACPSPRTQTPAGLKVDVDILTNKTWFRDAQLRISAAGEGKVQLHRIDIVRSLAFSRIASGLRKERLSNAPNWTKLGLPSSVQLDIPFLTQKTSRPELSGRLCSPTSVAMVVSWAQSPVSVETVANAAYDAPHDIYGNWPRNVQAAWEQGVPGKLVRIGTLKDAWRLLAAGVPIVASIKSKPSELAGAPYSETDGHLIVLRGYDSDGNFLVNDPAGSDAAKGQLVYARRDIATVWLTNGRGTAYLFTKPGQQHLLDSLEAPASPSAAEQTR